MVSRSRALLIAVLMTGLAAIACRRDASGLDDVGKMAYAVKPGVVRISAYATAHFRYDAAAIRTVEQLMSSRGEDVTAEKLDVDQLLVDTHPAGPGTGFFLNPNGLIFTR